MSPDDPAPSSLRDEQAPEACPKCGSPNIGLDFVFHGPLPLRQARCHRPNAVLPLVHLLDPPSQRGRPSREGAYDATAIKAIAEGLRSPAAVSRKTLLVRIPPFHEDAVASAARIKEAFAAGADGVTVPHVQSVDEARQVLQAFAAAKVNVWSPSNRAGEIAMLMIEDPGALGQVKAFADLGGIRILGCDIRSMTDAPGGDRQKGEQATHKQCLPRPSGSQCRT